jgi:outer membrane protein
MAILKKGKVALLLNVTLVLFGMIGLSIFHTDQAYAAKGQTSSIGIVDYTYLIEHHPDTPKANQALKTEQELAQKEYNEKSALLNDKGRQDLERLLNLRIEEKRRELLKPILEKINAAVKQVADAKGLSIVVYKNTVAYGGVDITQEVANKLTKK